MSRAPFAETRRYLEIVRALAQREFVARYRGNLFGLLPAVLVPLLLLLTYTFVFSKLIPVQIRPDAESGDYAFFLFSGLVGWNLFAEVVARAPRLFGDQAHFVREARFPASALAVASGLSAFYQSVLWLGVFVLARWVMQGEVSAAVWWSPLVLALLGVLAAGIALTLAALGALVRDLGELVGPLLALGLFLSPVLYPADRIAQAAPWLAELNPLVPQLAMLRATLLDGVLPELRVVGIAGLWCLGVIALGVAVHRRTRPLLADLV